ncbi:hypothetical protein B0T18DRAFT_458381 [Schizothecium vesticola]|uniref:Uncharacterized protein n=1 Tax=Schizothecium vesticola TaxID=314040 RepID=A0AA40KAJ3_9PEZI|nr:hypothetical protein B0T18DRAFT_458381 [Schizothecium vesticola]
MNSATVNPCPICGQIQCGCRPAVVPATRRGRGRPPQAKNNVYVNDKGEQVPAHLYNAEVKMKRTAAKAREKQRVATAAAADAERAAAESHKSPAKAKEAESKAAKAARAEEDAAAAWEKVIAAEKDFTKSNEKILARATKAKKVRSRANSAPLDQVPPAVQPTPQAYIFWGQPAPQLKSSGLQPPPQAFSQLNISLGVQPPAQAFSPLTFSPGVLPPAQAVFPGGQTALPGQFSSCLPPGQLSLPPQLLSYQPHLTPLPPPDPYLAPSPQAPWQFFPYLQPDPPEYGTSYPGMYNEYQSELEGLESFI